jgi:hypothetical protein
MTPPDEVINPQTPQEIPMKTRSTILALATLSTLSIAALAPTQALAWGHGGGGGV